jgi:hypothetical protein
MIAIFFMGCGRSSQELAAEAEKRKELILQRFRDAKGPAALGL